MNYIENAELQPVVFTDGVACVYCLHACDLDSDAAELMSLCHRL